MRGSGKIGREKHQVAGAQLSLRHKHALKCLLICQTRQRSLAIPKDILHVAGAVKALRRCAAKDVRNALILCCPADDILALHPLNAFLLRKGLPGQLAVGHIIQLAVRLKAVLFLKAFQRIGRRLRHFAAGMLIAKAQHVQLLLRNLQPPVALLHGGLLLILFFLLLGRSSLFSCFGRLLLLDFSRLSRLRLRRSGGRLHLAAYGRRRLLHRRLLMRLVAYYRIAISLLLRLSQRRAGQHRTGQQHCQTFFHRHHSAFC